MRRPAVCLLATLCIAAPTASVAQAPPAAAPVVQEAFARWDADGTTLTSEALHLVDAGQKVGTLAMRRCVDEICIGAAFTKKLADDAFQFDPSLAEASLAIKWNGVEHRIEWAGEGSPSVSFGGPTEPAPGMARDAEADGVVFDRKVVNETTVEAFLSQGDERAEGPTALFPGSVTGASTGGAGRGLQTNDDRCITFKRSERRFARLINGERHKRGQNRLRLDTELGKVARKHTAEMVAKALLHHTTSEDLTRRITRWRVLGENVGVGGGVTSLHDAFMNSPPHKENVLHRTYRHVGVGVAKEAGVMWVTVIFEARKNPGTTLRCA